MNIEYKHTKTTISLIKYHFVFCPRYRRKIFDIEGVEQMFEELTNDACKRCGIEVLDLDCNMDYVHIYVSVMPNMSVPNIMKEIKGATSLRLREEFPQLGAMPSLWTRNYFVSTAESVSPEIIEWYVNSQKTRP